MSILIESSRGLVTIPGGVLSQVAVRAAEQVDGVQVRRRRTVDVEGRVIRLTISVRRGERVLELAQRAQASVAATFETMCGYTTQVELKVAELS